MAISKVTNEVQMLGILPSQGADPIPVGKIPDGGTQIVKSGIANGGSVTVHTVSAGKTFYLSHAILTTYNLAEAANTANSLVTNATDDLQYYLHAINTPAGDGKCCPSNFMPPLEIPTGWKVKAISNLADLGALLFIHGYEA